jgi:hypothetical protein
VEGALGVALAVTGAGGALLTGRADVAPGGVTLAFVAKAGGEVRGSPTLPGSARQPLIMATTTMHDA